MTALSPTIPLHRSRPNLGHWSLLILLFIFFAIFLVWPILQVVSEGFIAPDGSVTLLYVRMIFATPALRQGMINAGSVAIAVTLLSFLIALPLAVITVRYNFPGRGILAGLLLVPLVLPPFVGALGVRLVLSRYGPLSQIIGAARPEGIDWLGGPWRILGIIIVQALHLYPIMLLNLQAALANIDPAMEQAAANLGASRFTVFHRITLPLMRPGVFAGATLVLIWSFTELGTPLVFDFHMITPVQIFKYVTDVASSPLPFALVVVTLIISAALYLIGKVMLGRSFEAATTKASVASSAKSLEPVSAALAIAFCLCIIILAVLPHLSVIVTSFTSTGAWYQAVLPRDLTLNHYHQALVDDLAIGSMRNSILYALVATALAMVIGLAAAVLIVRSRLPGRSVIDTLSMLPLAVPGLVMAFGYLAISVWIKRHWTGWPALQSIFGQSPPQWLDVQTNPVVLLIIAYAVRRLPYVVRSAVAGLQQTPRDLELAAANLGASRFNVLRRITVPLIMANLIAGGLLAFAFAMLEVSDSLILAQRSDYYPITKAILDISQRLGDGFYVASALGVWAMIVLTLTLLSANAFLGKKLGAIFRL